MERTQAIVYEQPLTEHIRLCLRLEHLFQQISQFSDSDETWHTRAIIDAIIEITGLIDRPELRKIFAKDLELYHIQLSRLSSTPHIDHSKLDAILDDLNLCLKKLSAKEGKFAQTLKGYEFLNTLRLYRSNPAGICAFDVPAYHYWLEQPLKIRQESLELWLAELETVRHAHALQLRLIRESAVSEHKTAYNGFYQLSLDPKHQNKLIRVIMSKDNNYYPEMSVGRHRICIRFVEPALKERPKSTEKDILFKLTCCS